MNWRIFFLIIIFVSTEIFAQNTRWEDHFSYRSVTGIIQVDDMLYCTSSHAIFSYDLRYNEVKKLSKANRLNAIQPTSLAYNPEFDYLLVGYQSGELDLLGERSYNFIEIPLDDYAGNKQINHLYTESHWMIISAAYGVSLFDLERREFAETAFFRQGGEYFTANESVIFNNTIFTASDRGIYSHEINDLIPNFNNWENATSIPNSPVLHIEKFNNQLLASNAGNIYYYQNGNWHYLRYFGNITDINANGNFVSITTSNKIFVLDSNLNVIYEINVNSPVQAGIFANNEAYVGSSDKGLIRMSSQESIFPDGPYSNSSFGVTAMQGHIWSAPGGILSYNLPALNIDGFSHFNGISWTHIPYQEMENVRDITQITPNPNNLSQVYATSWHEGFSIYEVVDDIPVAKIDHTNSSILENNLYGNPFLRFGGSAFDESGNLYITQTFVSPQFYNYLHKRTPSGTWTSYSLENYNQGAPTVLEPVIDNQGFVWIGSARGSGVVITNMNETYQILYGESMGDLPSSNVYAVAIDRSGTAWIGTQLGLRIKRNPIREFQSGNLDTEPIVIVQDGIPEALLTDVAVQTIAVDGSNRKWIGTDGAGAFYVSENGRETIFHFTEDNSPLPANTIYDISVDNSTGIVYFATEGGLVSYKGDAKETGDGFGEIVAYPNPVRPDYQGPITIKGLARNADVRITDVVGNLIYKGRASGGIIQWDGTNLKGQKVASGVYIALMINADGTETANTKIAIIR